ncbi:hypothetical protein EZV62_024862 [Acer yangbiense]|uniref:Uncharacterized protein n=1 Tax=Acer yangbiense TaxID=1000413 RepID=A0A5C7GWW5_9ROSI|nr:hypothetical protein EZV62_024862 [Acer yangbiense]
MQKVEGAFKGMVLEDPDPDQYQLIMDCNELSTDIEYEIVNIHNFIIVVSIAASTTNGKSLPYESKLAAKVANKFKHYGSSSGDNSGLTSIQGIELTT